MRHEFCAHRDKDEATGISLRIVSDDNPFNPREDYDNFGRMICWHGRYRLGDRHDYASPEAFRQEMKSTPHILLPLYLYDHSGLSMNTTGFHCPWDSGQVGWIRVSMAAVRQEYGVKRVTKTIREKAAALLKAEVFTYDQYLRGDVWGYEVEDREGEIIESCYGFFGEENAISEGRAVFADMVAERCGRQAESFASAAMAARPDLHGKA